MAKNSLIIYAVSDATGEIAARTAVAAARQFNGLDPKIRRRVHIDTVEKIDAVIEEAKREKAIILCTLVSGKLRDAILKKAEKELITVIDILGPVLDSLARISERAPSDQPGLQYQLTDDYLKKTEAISYAVKHDDGLGVDTIEEADIIILGISRTSKTPLSVYLASRGFKVANIPIVKDVDLPREVYRVDKRKLIGLSIDPEKLVSLRATRLKKLGRPTTEGYASIDYIKNEVAYQQRLFSSLGNIPFVTVTNKGIEEAATEILMILGL